jgi:hypothetical protein
MKHFTENYRKKKHGMASRIKSFLKNFSGKIYEDAAVEKSSSPALA